jgi:hypothetical protein
MESLKDWVATAIVFLSLSSIVSANDRHANIDHLIDQLRSLTKDSQRAIEIAALYDQLDSEWKSLSRQIGEALRQQKLELSERLPHLERPFLFNPWNQLNQVPPDFPTIDEVRFPSDHELREIPKTFLRESIPPIYRLAEYLGIGTNIINAEAFYSAPHLFYGEYQSYEIKARVDQHIFGSFQINGTKSVVETFRRSLESQGFINAIDIRISREVKPHHFSLREIPLSETYILNRHSEWNTERMKHRFPLHSVAIAVSAAKQDEQERTTGQVRQLMENRFAEYRKTMARNVESVILQSKSFRHFNTHLISVHKLESAGHNEGGTMAPCLWVPKNSNPTEFIRERIALLCSLKVENQLESLLPEDIRLSAIHTLRHAAPPSKSQHAAEIAWLARFSIIERGHD